jgi:uncharacterized protein (DUF2147 family)
MTLAACLAAGAAEPVKPARSDFQSLEGRWVRPDGGYILELKDVGPDGSLKATYFNPRPIRVHRAEAARKDGAISLFVGLRDVNYPGSTYRLQYDTAKDRLMGTYFQAVERRTFNVQFLRSR